MFMLACGPYFNEQGLVGGLVLFLLVKPLAYFAFINAFRYRVSRPVPMRIGQAIGLAAARAGLGIGIIGIGVGALVVLKNDQLWAWSWIYLYAERIFSWWLVGARGAGLRGRRLFGWIISGTLLNAAFDVAVVWGLMEGPAPQVAIAAMIALFIIALHVVGRRDSLKARFASQRKCAACDYDLTGNLSGRCPECGSNISLSLAVPA
jgi:hypothetical protein